MVPAARRFLALHSGLLVTAAFIGTTAGSVARAQSAEANVGVLRSTGASIPAELAEAVDAALLRDLAEIAGIVDPVVSPIELAEIQLSVGCADNGRACLESMASAAGVRALLVRSLSADETHARLSLHYFDSASSDEPKLVSAELAASSSAELTQAVPALVRELFGIPEVTEAAEPSATDPSAGPATDVSTGVAEPPYERAPAEPSGVSIAPFILMGAGAVALTVGIVVGATATDDFRDWKERPLRTMAEADQANADFEDLETRALAADVSMLAGAVLLGVGVSWLAVELGDERSDGANGPTLALAPRPGGATLLLHGPLGEVP